MILDKSHLDTIVKPGAVILVKVEETCSQLDLLVEDLQSIPKTKLIYENGRNTKLIDDSVRQGFIPVMLLGHESLNAMVQNVKHRVTHTIKSSDYLSQTAVDVFIF